MTTHDPIREARARYSLAERVLIVPLAHLRIADVGFQTEMYELFHRTTMARLGHLVGTPTVLFGLWMLTAQAPEPLGVVLAAGLWLYIAIWGFAVDRSVGALAALGGAVLATGAFAAASAAEPHALPIALATTLGGCAVQTLSHLFEEVPPPQSGTDHFVPMKQWIRGVGLLELARSTVLTVAVFYWLELWAAPRVWPLQILQLAMGAGYRPELRKMLDERVAAILAQPAGPWRKGG